MKKVIRLTEHDLQSIIKRVIREKDKEINELNVGNAVDAGLKVGETLGLDSDWANILNSYPGLSFVKPTYDGVKAFRTMQKQTFEENMEQIRHYAGGVKGVATAVALDMVGAGAIINPTFWGVFLIYDCWLGGKKGTYDLFNIIMDIIGVATAGVGAAFAKGFKSIMAPVAKSSVSKFVGFMAKNAPKLFEYFSKIIKNSASIFKTVNSQFYKAFSGFKTKLPMLTKGFESLKSGFSTFRTLMKQLEQAVGHKISHGVKHFVKHKIEHKVADDVVSSVVGKGEKQGTNLTQNKKPQTIPRYITVNGIKKPNPKFKQKYGYA